MSVITNRIEIKQFAYSDTKRKDKRVTHLAEKIARVGVDMLTNKFENDDIIEYFNSISKDEVIIEPIYYKNTVLGFAAIISGNQAFNEKNSTLAGILMEGLNSRVEVLFLNEELDKTNREKIQFLASISHEYKTPLNSIIGFSDMLKTELVGTSMLIIFRKVLSFF